MEAQQGASTQLEHSEAAGKGKSKTTASLRAEQHLADAQTGDIEPLRRLTEKTTEHETFKQADARLPAPSLLQSNDGCWIREGTYRKRVHVKPRTALYKPEHTEDGPDSNVLTAYRSTMAKRISAITKQAARRPMRLGLHQRQPGQDSRTNLQSLTYRQAWAWQSTYMTRLSRCNSSRRAYRTSPGTAEGTQPASTDRKGLQHSHMCKTSSYTVDCQTCSLLPEQTGGTQRWHDQLLQEMAQGTQDTAV